MGDHSTGVNDDRFYLPIWSYRQTTNGWKYPIPYFFLYGAAALGFVCCGVESSFALVNIEPEYGLEDLFPAFGSAACIGSLRVDRLCHCVRDLDWSDDLLPHRPLAQCDQRIVLLPQYGKDFRGYHLT